MNALDMLVQTLFYIVLALAFFVAVWLVSLTKNVSALTMLVNDLREKIAVRPTPQERASVAFTPVADKGQFVAAVSAALAEHMGTNIGGLRIRSIKRLGADSSRVRFIAAVAAAIAEDMGRDVTCLRIKSVRKI